MSQEEAQIYADAVVEKLHEWRIIPDDKYGRMTENQRQDLATLVREKSEE